MDKMLTHVSGVMEALVWKPATEPKRILMECFATCEFERGSQWGIIEVR